MIEIIKEKEIIKRIIIIFLFIFLFNFVFAHLGNNIVFAEEEKAVGEEVSDEEIMENEGAGPWLLPLHSLVIFLADVVLQIMQNNFISSQEVTIKATSKDTQEVNRLGNSGNCYRCRCSRSSKCCYLSELLQQRVQG